MNPAESLHSAKNRLFWEIRSRLRFRRPGYRETGAESLALTPLETELEREFSLAGARFYLAPETYRKNLYTLWLLRQMLEHYPEGRGDELEILEPGCQDFARLPALAAFFRNRGYRPRITGLELDPYPVLHDFHSRWDKAQYYVAQEPPGNRYLGGNFFHWASPAHLVVCFYPFVSPHPALAWGLPAHFGDPAPWLAAFARNVRPGGSLLVVHQGAWEQDDFDQARAAFPFALLARRALEADFYPLPHPACASLYRRNP